jgi:hypothetical protein
MRGVLLHCVKTVFNRRIALGQAPPKYETGLNRFLFRHLAQIV